MKKQPNPIDRHVGSRIRARRMMLGMSQEQLGDAIDLTFQQVQKYEKGTNRVGGSRLHQIATILKVPPAFFFEGAPEVGVEAVLTAANEIVSPSAVSDFLATKEGIEFIRSFTAIKRQKLRRAIVNLVDEIATED